MSDTDLRIDVRSAWEEEDESWPEHRSHEVLAADWGHALILADGIGDNPARGLAAQVAAEAIRHFVLEAAVDSLRPTAYQQLLWDAIKLANVEVHDWARADDALAGIGASVAVALVIGGSAYVAHAGDCRICLFSRGTTSVISDDHLPGHNSDGRYVGMAADVDPEVYPSPIRLHPGDGLLLCTPQVASVLSAVEMADVVGDRSVEDVASALTALATRLGAVGNRRALFARVEGDALTGDAVALVSAGNEELSLPVEVETPPPLDVPSDAAESPSGEAKEPDEAASWEEDALAEEPPPLPTSVDTVPSWAPGGEAKVRTWSLGGMVAAFLLGVAATLSLSVATGLIATEDTLDEERRAMVIALEAQIAPRVEKLSKARTEGLQRLNMKLGAAKGRIKSDRLELQRQEATLNEFRRKLEKNEVQLSEREKELDRKLAALREGPAEERCTKVDKPRCDPADFTGKSSAQVELVARWLEGLETVYRMRRKVRKFQRSQSLFDSLDVALLQASCPQVHEACSPMRDAYWAQYKAHTVLMIKRRFMERQCGELDRWLELAGYFRVAKSELGRATVARCLRALDRRAGRGGTGGVEDPATDVSGEFSEAGVSATVDRPMTEEDKRLAAEKKQQAREELERVKEMMAEEARKRAEE